MKAIVLSTLAVVGACCAAPTIDWEIELTNYVGSVDSARSLKQYSDGSVAFVLENKLLVFNSDSSLKLSDTITNEFFYCEGFGDHASNPNFISLSFRASPEFFSRNYTITEEGYSVENIPSVAFTVGSAAGADNTVWYTIVGTKLRKYNLDNPPTVGGNVASGIDGSNYILNWESTSGAMYQIQSSLNLTNWVDVGLPITGTGSSLTWANALTNSQSFFRVIKK